MAECFETYLSRPGGIQPYDAARIVAFNDSMGSRGVADLPGAWQEWMRAHPRQAAGTIARWRTILLAAVRMGCGAHGVTPPTLPGVKQRAKEAVPYLSPAERRRLLAAYPPHAACPVLLLAYQGMRTQEVLRLDWRAVDTVHGTIRIRGGDGTKSGKGRSVPMHAKVQMLLVGMWASAGQPDRGPVFLSSRGEPYQDTRGVGGNPLKKQHALACTTAGITDFRVHDWRHDWAARCVMSGMDLYTLMRLGGWASLRMVERYASISAEHARDAMSRVA